MKNQKKWITIGIIVIALFAFGKYNEVKQAKEKQLQSKEIVEIEKSLTYAERFEKKYFNEIRGGYKPVKNYLKENLKDPSSLEIVNTWNNGMNKDSTFAIKTTFRAKNEYNATVLQAIYCNIDIDGNLSEIRIE